ncbi:MAG TPA: LysE family transporter [Syntrophales bacterium]|nr:LysE family transporter [Syntrophales bacterium]HOL59200.1 LysE family transporter [Syntrophales bacterium]HPO35719.1 LysE family transporter [Syntrophales bacterium]
MILAFATVFSTAFLIALSGALMPGPLLMVTISESPRRGFLTGPLLALGHSVLEGILVLAVMVGLSPFLKRSGVFETIAVLGAGMLMYMAWGMIKGLSTLSLKGHDTEARPRSLILAGAMVSLANPYWSLWWITVGLGYVIWSMNFGPWGVILFFFGHILADFTWYSAVSLAFSRGKALFSDRVYRGLVGICALFLIGFACYFLSVAVSNLSRLSLAGT